MKECDNSKIHISNNFLLSVCIYLNYIYTYIHLHSVGSSFLTVRSLINVKTQNDLKLSKLNRLDFPP